MIKSRKYNDEDFEAIDSWYKSRGSKASKDLLPKIGFIVPGVAAGFLMQTDTGCCILEPFIANRYTDKAERHSALDAIMRDLIYEAKTLGFSRIFGFSSNEPMIARSLKHGFVIVEESTTVVKEL